MNRGRPAASRSAPQDRPAIEANFAAVRREMNLSSQQIVTLARNLFDACFATEAQRSRWEAELEAVAAGADGVS